MAGIENTLQNKIINVKEIFSPNFCSQNLQNTNPDLNSNAPLNDTLADPQSSISTSKSAETSLNENYFVEKSQNHINLAQLHKTYNIENVSSKVHNKADMPKSKKSVTFHRDIVSGYMDAPLRWHHASECNTEELVSAYLKSCDQFETKPIPELLSQLQAIVNFEERNETLSLRKVIFNSKVCETLEEVLKRVQFRTIDLQSGRFTEEASTILFDLIEYYESCLKLNISSIKSISIRGLHSLGRLLRKSSFLWHLDANKTNFYDNMYSFMIKALRTSPCLTSLHLEAAIFNGKPFEILMSALQNNKVLRELYLGSNKLSGRSLIHLSHFFHINKTLKLLDLRSNGLNDLSIQPLFNSLSSQTNCDGSLETLVLWDNLITSDSMAFLSYFLPLTQSLIGLNLGKNPLKTEGIHKLKNGLISNKSLIRLGLQDCGITCEGAVAIAEYLAETKCLLRLDLRDNDIRTGGMMAISLSLKINKTLVRLDLDKEPKKENSIRNWFEQQKQLLVDISNYVAQNNGLAEEKEKWKKEEARKKIKEEETIKNSEIEKKEIKNFLAEASTTTAFSSFASELSNALERLSSNESGENISITSSTLNIKYSTSVSTTNKQVATSVTSSINIVNTSCKNYEYNKNNTNNMTNSESFNQNDSESNNVEDNNDKNTNEKQKIKDKSKLSLSLNYQEQNKKTNFDFANNIYNSNDKNSNYSRTRESNSNNENDNDNNSFYKYNYFMIPPSPMVLSCGSSHLVPVETLYIASPDNNNNNKNSNNNDNTSSNNKSFDIIKGYQLDNKNYIKEEKDEEEDEKEENNENKEKTIKMKGKSKLFVITPTFSSGNSLLKKNKIQDQMNKKEMDMEKIKEKQTTAGKNEKEKKTENKIETKEEKNNNYYKNKSHYDAIFYKIENDSKESLKSISTNNRSITPNLNQLNSFITVQNLSSSFISNCSSSSSQMISSSLLSSVSSSQKIDLSQNKNHTNKINYINNNNNEIINNIATNINNEKYNYDLDNDDDNATFEEIDKT